MHQATVNLKSSLSSVCIAFVLNVVIAAFGIVSALAQPAPDPKLSDFGLEYLTSNQKTLQQLAAANTDQGAVQVYLTGYGGGYDMRLCVYGGGSDGDSLSAWRCKFNEPQQKWLLTRKGQVVAQANPKLCWTWGGSNGAGIVLKPCASGAVPDSQKFLFSPAGLISDTQGAECLNMRGANSGDGTAVIGWTCSSSASNEQWTIQPDPAQLVSIPREGNSTYSYAVQGASTEYSAWLTFVDLGQGDDRLLTLNAYWFFTPANDGTRRFFIQNAQTGYCLTAPGGESIVVDGCKVPGKDAAQKWTVDSDGSIYNAATQSYLSYNWRGAGAFNSPESWPAVKSEKLEYPQKGLGKTSAALNIALIHVDGSGQTSCLAAKAGSDDLQKLTCSSSMQEIHLASFDLLPNHTLRSRVTGQCVDNYGSQKPGRVGQWKCDPATSNAKENQQWYAGEQSGKGYMGSWPFGKSAYLDAGKSRYVLLEDLVGGQMLLRDAAQYAKGSASFPSAQWSVASASELANCADTPLILKRVGTGRQERSPRNDVMQIYDLLSAAISLAITLDHNAVPRIQTNLYMVQTQANNIVYARSTRPLRDTLHALMGMLLDDEGNIDPNALLEHNTALTLWLTARESSYGISNTVAANSFNPPLIYSAMGQLASIRHNILRLLLPSVGILDPWNCAVASGRHFQGNDDDPPSAGSIALPLTIRSY